MGKFLKNVKNKTAQNKFFYGFYFTTLLFSVLFAFLSLWQFNRLQWKEELIATRQALLEAPSVLLPNIVSMSDPLPPSFFLQQYHVKGLFKEHSLLFVDSVAPESFRKKNPNKSPIGYKVFGLFETTKKILLATELGWIPEKEKFTYNLPKKSITFLLQAKRNPEKHWWQSSPYFITDNILSRISIKLMAQRWRPIISSYYFKVTKISSFSSAWPTIDNQVIDLPNNHLSYALTWLFLSLIIAYMAIMHFKKSRAFS